MEEREGLVHKRGKEAGESKERDELRKDRKEDLEGNEEDMREGGNRGSQETCQTKI